MPSQNATPQAKATAEIQIPCTISSYASTMQGECSTGTACIGLKRILKSLQIASNRYGRQHSGSARLIANPNHLHVGEGGTDRVVALGGRHEKEEAAAAGTGQLAAVGAGLQGLGVPAVDLAVGDLRRQGLLGAPTLVQQAAERRQIEAMQHQITTGERVVAQMAQFIQPVFDIAPLLDQNFGGVALDAGPKHQATGYQPTDTVVTEPQMIDRNALVGIEDDVIEASEGGGILILFADRALENLNLDVTGLFGQLTRRNLVATKGV